MASRSGSIQQSWLNALAEATIVCDVDGTVVAWNEAATELYGWDSGPVAGRSILDLVVPPAERDHATAIMQRIQQGESWQGDFLVHRTDGSLFLAGVNASPILDDNGATSGILCRATDVTTERVREQGQAEARRIRQAIGQDAPALIAVLRVRPGRNPELVFLNDEWERYTGLAREQLRRGDNPPLHHPEDLDPTDILSLREMMQAGKDFQQYVRLRNAHGEYRWFMFHHRAVVGGEQHMPLAVLVGVEVHQQVEERNAAANREAVLRRLADAIPALIIISADDTDGTIRPIFFNQRWVEYSGVDQEVLFQRDHGELYSPEDRAAIERLLEQATEQNTALNGEFRVQRADGEHRWHYVVHAPVRDLAGNLTMFVTVAVDVHDARLADEVRSRLAAIVDSSQDAIISKTLDGTLTSWNRGAEQLYGYSADEALGKSIFLIVPEERSHEVLDMLSRLRNGEHIPTFETERVHKDGHRVRVALSVAPLSNREGVPIGAAAIARDVSEQHRMLEELRVANSVKEDFLSLVSHELRTPMTTMLGLARVLGRRADQYDPDTQAIHRDLLHYANRLESLIANILTLTRLGQQGTEFEPVLVQRIAAKIVERHRHDHRDRKVALEIPKDLPAVEGHQVWLEQVLGNLLSNAEKYSPPAKPIIISAEVQGSSVAVRIADGGPGITPDEAAHVFDAFYHSHRTGEAPGAGLGLAVCKQLIELQGGDIHVVPGQEKGTVMEFTLPVSQPV